MSSDNGVRSIEVNISNMLMASLTVGGVQKDSSNQWIKGLQPVQNSQLAHYTGLPVGVMTTVTNQEVGGSLVLTGYGDPISINFSNSVHDKSICDCPGNDQVKAESHPVQTGDPTHAQWNLKLVDR